MRYTSFGIIARIVAPADVAKNSVQKKQRNNICLHKNTQNR